MDKAATVKQLCEEIKKAAMAKDFTRAESLRDKLLEVDSMALSEIVAAAKVIEEQKATGVDASHLATWKSLYKKLTPEETSELFYAFRKIDLPERKVLCKQGKLNNKLIFIEEGTLVAVFTRKGKNFKLFQLDKGEFACEDTFFGISFCTASVVSQTPVQIYVLDKVRTASWDDNFPGLYEKLGDYCHKHGRMEKAMGGKNLELREHERFVRDGVVTGTLLDKEGNKTDRYYRSSVSDISRGGTCFSIKCSTHAIASNLLGKPVDLSFVMDKVAGKQEFVVTGKIIRVKFLFHNDFSVHIKFDELLSNDQIEK